MHTVQSMASLSANNQFLKGTAGLAEQAPLDFS